MHKSLQIFGACSLLILSQMAYAQKEKNIWYFGYNAGVDFNGGIPVALTNSAMVALEGCSSIADNNGKLLFYTNGVSVWDATHHIMPNGDSLQAEGDATQSSLIVRKPGSDQLYYIFTLPRYPDTTLGLGYSIVDMNRNNGLGDIVDSLKNIPIYNPVDEKLVGVVDRNKNVWIIVHGRQSNSFLAFYVNSSGVSLTPVVSNIGSTYNNKNTHYGLGGYLKSSPNGQRLATAVVEKNVVELFDFNFCTGEISNLISLPHKDSNTFAPYTDAAYGVSFSPDNSKLYVARGANFGPIVQYDLNAGGGNGDSIRASKTSITPAWLKSSVYSALQLGPDGKIYVGHNIGYYLGCINNPNAVKMACSFVDSAVDLENGRSVLGLPNFIDGLHVDSTCVCDLLSIATKNYYGASSGECCSQLTLHNLLGSGMIYSVSATIVSPIATVKNASGPWNPQPTWSSKNISWSIPPPGLAKGIRDSLFACFNNSGDSSIKIAIGWNDAAGRTLCVDTLIINCNTSSVNENTSADNYSGLGQNYPNPFSSTTTIPVNGEGIFEVRDILGRVVYKTNIDVAPSRFLLDGSNLSNGLYEYSLSDGNAVQFRTMIIMK